MIILSLLISFSHSFAFSWSKLRFERGDSQFQFTRGHHDSLLKQVRQISFSASFQPKEFKPALSQQCYHIPRRANYLSTYGITFP
jgi:hypothetical protein